MEQVVVFAEFWKLVLKSGAWYSLGTGDTKLQAQGLEKFAALLGAKENSKRLMALAKEVQDKEEAWIRGTLDDQSG